MFIVITTVVELLLYSSIATIDKYTLVTPSGEKCVGGPGESIRRSDMLAHFALAERAELVSECFITLKNF
jgi:hypothetical protein